MSELSVSNCEYQADLTAALSIIQSGVRNIRRQASHGSIVISP